MDALERSAQLVDANDDRCAWWWLPGAATLRWYDLGGADAFDANKIDQALTSCP